MPTRSAASQDGGTRAQTAGEQENALSPAQMQEACPGGLLGIKRRCLATSPALWSLQHLPGSPASLSPIRDCVPPRLLSKLPLCLKPFPDSLALTARAPVCSSDFPSSSFSGISPPGPGDPLRPVIRQPPSPAPPALSLGRKMMGWTQPPGTSTKRPPKPRALYSGERRFLFCWFFKLS